MSETKTERQPKIYQRMLLRFAIGLLLIAALVFGYQWFRNVGQFRSEFGEARTLDSIAAIEYDGTGASRVVLIDAQGKVTPCPDFEGRWNVRDVTWRPDGTQIFFSSDKPPRKTEKQSAFNVFRWNLSNGEVDPKSYGTVGRTALAFYPKDSKETEWPLLYVMKGNAWELNAIKGETRKVFPHIWKTEERDQRTDSADDPSSNTEYGGPGDRFGTERLRAIRYAADRSMFVAVRRNEASETLMAQPATGPEDKPWAIAPLVTSKRLDFDVNPQNGDVILAVAQYRSQGAEGEEMREPDAIDLTDVGAEEKIKFSHGLFILHFREQGIDHTLFGLSTNDDAAFRSLTVSPDGTRLALVAGKYDPDQGVAGDMLVLQPLSEGGVKETIVLARDSVDAPNWHPGGSKLVFTKEVGGKRHIFVVNADGSGLKQVTSGDKSYALPKFSPQAK